MIKKRSPLSPLQSRNRAMLVVLGAIVVILYLVGMFRICYE